MMQPGPAAGPRSVRVHGAGARPAGNGRGSAAGTRAGTARLRERAARPVPGARGDGHPEKPAPERREPSTGRPGPRGRRASAVQRGCGTAPWLRGGHRARWKTHRRRDARAAVRVCCCADLFGVPRGCDAERHLGRRPKPDVRVRAEMSTSNATGRLLLGRRCGYKSCPEMRTT
ncbi:uncharacterized protein ACIQIH_003091 isoform 1-T5 [Cyanocitta cristata]